MGPFPVILLLAVVAAIIWENVVGLSCFSNLEQLDNGRIRGLRTLIERNIVCSKDADKCVTAVTDDKKLAFGCFSKKQFPTDLDVSDGCRSGKIIDIQGFYCFCAQDNCNDPKKTKLRKDGPEADCSNSRGNPKGCRDASPAPSEGSRAKGSRLVLLFSIGAASFFIP